MALQPDSSNPDDLCVLNDVRLFNLSTRRWLPVVTDPSANPMAPKARYAHLSSVAANRLFIIGGQDLSNVWLDNIHVLDLQTQTWVLRREYPRHCGTYRSVAVSSHLVVRFPQDEIKSASSTTTTLTSSTPTKTSENLLHLPYSALPTDEYPSDIYLFSNYNVSVNLCV
jgi:leucine-zipper-like transcriptional regulator 1